MKNLILMGVAISILLFVSHSKVEAQSFTIALNTEFDTIQCAGFKLYYGDREGYSNSRNLVISSEKEQFVEVYFGAIDFEKTRISNEKDELALLVDKVMVYMDGVSSIETLPKAISIGLLLGNKGIYLYRWRNVEKAEVKVEIKKGRISIYVY